VAQRAPGTAIVTGASSGIGAAIARRLHDDGFTVYAAARRLGRMAGLVRAGVHAMGVDVTDDEALRRLVDRAVDDTGRIDVLVNNAGYGSFGAVEDVPLAHARRQFEVNVFAVARLCQLVLPHMRDARSGRIVNISSIGSKVYQPCGAWYHASKFAVEGLSDCLRMECAPLGIQVVVVQPGGVVSEFSTAAGESLVRASGRGAYADQARRVATYLAVDPAKVVDKAGAVASAPSVVADAVARAVTARRPRTRYRVGRGAEAIAAARWLLPDRAFDRVIDRTIDFLDWFASRKLGHR
jgi:NAD(P)-dependent dehydrogenase (short-subunit alcohol dehydrogenase family)